MDFHNHVMPGVDDGARDLEEALAAVAAFEAEGVEVVVATPHFPASRTERPATLLDRLERMDEAFEALREGVERAGATVRLERGAEIRLNAPDPNLADARLRLAGTRFVLVEFSAFQMPPYGSAQLAEIRDQGWIPILAHPERYFGMAGALHEVEEWREHAYFQVNAGSLLGEYGPAPRKAARLLFEHGWVDYLSSDFHARGEPGLLASRALLLETGRISSRPGSVPADEPGDPTADEPGDPTADAAEPTGDRPSDEDPTAANVADLLTEVNPGRLLEDRKPLPVPAVEIEAGVWERVRGFFAP